MPSDSICLLIGGKRHRHFISYTVESDLYVSDHAFSLELANPEAEITPGMECRLYVNDQLELSGVVDRRFRRCDKSGRKLTVEGRDLMGLIVDSYCEQFVDVQGKHLSDLAQMLLKDVPFINLKNITYQQDVVGKLKTRRSRRGTPTTLDALFSTDTAQRLARIAPGMTKFQALQTYALSRGLMFYGLPDGTFVFGKPLAGGDPEYELIINQAGIGNNVISAELDENISKRYSKVTVVGMQQAHVDSDGTSVVSQTPSGVAKDPGVPFYKPFVACNNNDSQSPQLHARLLLERMRHDGFRLTYELPRHSQNGRNFTINKMAKVRDEIHGVVGDYLVTGRTFRLSKDAAPTTTLKLGLPGLVEDMPMKRGHR